MSEKRAVTVLCGRVGRVPGGRRCVIIPKCFEERYIAITINRDIDYNYVSAIRHQWLSGVDSVEHTTFVLWGTLWTNHSVTCL